MAVRKTRDRRSLFDGPYLCECHSFIPARPAIKRARCFHSSLSSDGHNSQHNTFSLIPRMMGRPPIAMGSFMPGVNGDGWSIARQNLITGADVHPRTRQAVESANVVHFGQEHNVLDNRTVIGMIVPRRWFEFG